MSNVRDVLWLDNKKLKKKRKKALIIHALINSIQPNNYSVTRGVVMDSYIGQIQLFAFGFAPYGWMQCSGQTLQIVVATR